MKIVVNCYLKLGNFAKIGNFSKFCKISISQQKNWGKSYNVTSLQNKNNWQLFWGYSLYFLLKGKHSKKHILSPTPTTNLLTARQTMWVCVPVWDVDDRQLNATTLERSWTKTTQRLKKRKPLPRKSINKRNMKTAGFVLFSKGEELERLNEWVSEGDGERTETQNQCSLTSTWYLKRVQWKWND